MTATPIPTHLVHTVFQYVLPPSLPIPAHLLSRPLMERHHFLSITATDSESYLCWPSPHTTQVIEALESESEHTLTPEPEHDVRYYTPDAETLHAHIRPHDKSPLQIVFTWDVITETWRYHDTRFLPFPPSAHPSLDVALATWAKAVSEFQLSLGDAEESSGENDDPSPDYWAGYDTSDSSPTSPTVPVTVTEEDEEDKAEAAYWASYSTVHGSGDSTVPSPIPQKDRFPGYQKQPHLRGSDIPTDPLVTNLHLKLHGRDNDLLSPRFHLSQFEHLDSPNVPETQADMVPSLSKSAHGRVTEDYGFPPTSDFKAVGSNTPGMSCDGELCVMGRPTFSDKNHGGGEEDAAVKETVRGIYRMWKGGSSSANAGAFLDVVKSALEGL